MYLRHIDKLKTEINSDLEEILGPQPEADLCHPSNRTIQACEVSHSGSNVSSFKLRDYNITKLEADASNRVYYRISGPQIQSDNIKGETIILMVLADPDPHQKPEEITGTASAEDGEGNKIDELPFINVQRQLANAGLPVPALYRYNADAGLLYLEDFGDTLLEDETVRVGPEGAIDYYRKAIEWLVKFQASGNNCTRDGFVAFTRQFDYNLYFYEFMHFLEYGIEASQLEAGHIDQPPFGSGPRSTEAHERQGRRQDVSNNDREIIERNFSEMSRRLAGFDRILCHRDYHSRNLLVRPSGEIGIIDFQDALMAHQHYDLASLLRDSYVVLPDEMRDELIALYLEKWKGSTGEKLDPVEFRKVFDLTSIHRNLKAAGRFDFIDIRKGNPKFKKYIPQTLGYVKENFLKYPAFSELHKALANYVPELK